MRPSLVTSRLSWRERNADLIAIKSEASISGRLRVGSTRRGHSRPVLLVQACPDASADWQDVARFVGEHSAIRLDSRLYPDSMHRCFPRNDMQ